MESSASNFGQKFAWLPNVRNAPVRDSRSDGLVLDRQQHEHTEEIGSPIHLQMLSLSLTSPPNLSSNWGTVGSNGRLFSERCVLPNWKTDLTLSEILQNGLLLPFAKEKIGSQRLQALYLSSTSEERKVVAKLVIENSGVFMDLACNMFGNFFLHKVIEFSTSVEQYYVASHLKNNIFQLCLDKFANRVVQNALKVLSDDLKLDVASQLARTDLVRLCIDQNANHVIQKMISQLPVNAWAFLIHIFVYDEVNLFETIENKYGCRIVQLAIERMVEEMTSSQFDNLLKKLLNVITKNCMRLTLNEFSNYIVQYVISCKSLGQYRDIIIEHCLLRNLLSMAQDKHASHVVVKALRHASSIQVCEMMEEIFDGYLPHPETGMDALDIMIFNQFGNYIIQELIEKCVEAARIWSSGQTSPDVHLRLNWLRRLSGKISSYAVELSKSPSGMKIIEILGVVPPILLM